MQIWNFGWNGQAIWMYKATLYIAVAYIFLCKLNYGYHNQAHFHQYLPNGMFFSSEICYGLWEKYELSCETKIAKGLKKWKDRTGLL